MQWEELSAGLQAYEAEKKALHSSIEQSKQELRGTEDEEQRIKQAFLHACSLLNANFRCAYHASVPTACSKSHTTFGSIAQSVRCDSMYGDSAGTFRRSTLESSLTMWRRAPRLRKSKGQQQSPQRLMRP